MAKLDFSKADLFKNFNHVFDHYEKLGFAGTLDRTILSASNDMGKLTMMGLVAGAGFEPATSGL